MASVRPLYASEKLLPGPPFMGCGISSDWFATMLATGNEAGRTKHARQKGQAARRGDLKRAWRAFSQQVPADSNGWVDQGDIELIHRAMFPDLPQPSIGRFPLGDVWDAIGDYAVSIALDTSAVPASDPIRRYVGGVPHQVVEWKKKGTGAQRQTLHMCPMHAPSDAYQGHWVEWSSVVRCAKAIAGSEGEAFAVLYPVGDWTQAKLATRQARETIANQRKVIDRQKTKVAVLEREAKAMEREIAALELKLSECGDDDAVRLAALDEAIAAIEALKDEP